MYIKYLSYYRLQQDSEVEIEDEVDILMSTDIIAAQMSTKNITFSRAQSGWIFHEDKKEVVGGFHADVYQINGLVLESKKRREHLSEEDLEKNRAVMQCLRGGSQDFCNGTNCDVIIIPLEIFKLFNLIWLWNKCLINK